MSEVTAIMDCLARTPGILVSMLEQIPEDRYSIRRIPGKWSIHEQVCHLVDAQAILSERFVTFAEEQNPVIVSHNPGQAEDHYQKMDMHEQLARFPAVRTRMLEMLHGFCDVDGEAYWDKPGSHQAFEPYTPRILLHHTLNVDYGHLFSIEQLGLTRDGLENEIMTLP